MILPAEPDPDACVHGWPLNSEKPRFFCNYRSRTVAEVIAAEPVIPQHRNPPAAEPRQSFSISPQRGGEATRRRKAAERGSAESPPRAKPAEPSKGGQCTGTTLEGKRCQRNAANGRFCLHHDPERAGARDRWHAAVSRAVSRRSERAAAGRGPAADAPSAAAHSEAPGAPPANRADIAGRKGGSAEHSYRPLPRALRRLQNLERQLDQMKETVRRCIADLAAAQKGEPQP